MTTPRARGAGALPTRSKLRAFVVASKRGELGRSQRHLEIDDSMEATTKDVAVTMRMRTASPSAPAGSIGSSRRKASAAAVVLQSSVPR